MACHQGISIGAPSALGAGATSTASASASSQPFTTAIRTSPEFAAAAASCGSNAENLAESRRFCEGKMTADLHKGYHKLGRILPGVLPTCGAGSSAVFTK